MATPWVKVQRFLSRRKYAYVRTFMNPPGQEVLEDLAKFCRAAETCFNPDPRIHAVLEGRREVWLRIQRHLQLTDEQLFALHVPATQTSQRRDDDE